MAQEVPGWSLPQRDLLLLIDAFHKKRLWVESIPVMAEYVSQHPPQEAPVRMKLAQILTFEKKSPGQALKVLAKIDAASLNASQQTVLRQLRSKAEALRAEHPYELAGEDW
jgi:hypothetical protein